MEHTCHKHGCYDGNAVDASQRFCAEHTCTARGCGRPKNSDKDEFCGPCKRRVRCCGLCKPPRSTPMPAPHPTHPGQTVENLMFCKTSTPPDAHKLKSDAQLAVHKHKPGTGQPAGFERRQGAGIQGHPRVGTKFVCLIPNHDCGGLIGTIRRVFEADPPPRPPRLVVGVTWDDGNTTPAGLDQLALDATNHIATPSCNRHVAGDVVALKASGSGNFHDFAVIEQVHGSRYLVKESGRQRQFEVEFNAANSYRPHLTHEVRERPVLVQLLRARHGGGARPCTFCIWCLGGGSSTLF